jgi:hypothetical protein
MIAAMMLTNRYPQYLLDLSERDAQVSAPGPLPEVLLLENPMRLACH